MEELDFIIETTKELMDESIKYLEKELLNIRAGKANPNMISSLKVEYYGSLTPLNQISNIGTPDSQTISIQPFDKSVIGDIEKAVVEANLGLNPMNNGELILINIPALTTRYFEKEPNDTIGSYNDTQIRATPIASSTILEYKNHRKLPADYTTGLIGHWDSSNPSSYAGSQGNPVSTWNDISSNSNNLTVTATPLDTIGGSLLFYFSNAVDTSASGISGPPITFGSWLWIYKESIQAAEDGAPIILGSDDSNNIGLYIKKSGSDAIFSYKWGNSNTTVDNFNSGLIIPREDPVFWLRL